MQLKVPAIVRSGKNHKVIKGDIFDTVAQHSFDLAYLDPPYGSNNEKMPPSRIRYAAYYHLWTTIIRNDTPEIFGKVYRRSDTRDGLSASVFVEFRNNKNGDFIAMDALRKLIQQTNARYIVLSYSSGGRATQEQLLHIISENAKLIDVKKIDYRKNIMSTLRSTNEWISNDEKHQEYIFLMEKI
jgi:adenine-specific DNA-methyltransferase